MLLSFAKRNKVNLTLIFLLIVSMFQMSLDAKKKGRLSVPEELLLDAASIAQGGITFSYQTVRNTWFGYFYLVGVNQENRRLRDETSEIRNRLNSLQEVNQENQRLKDLLYIKEATGYETTTARVIGMSQFSFFKTLLIDKGSDDNVRKDMAVISKDGLVGKILSSSTNTSKVLLITDRNSNVDALIQRSRDTGIAEGVDGLVHLKYLSKDADAVLGDTVITSGVGGLFKKGCIIGTVSKIENKAGKMFQNVEVKPSVNFSKLEEVLVITEPPAEIVE